MKRKQKVDGDCDPATKPSYVICRVFEVDVTNKTRTRVAAGADTPKAKGHKLSWTMTLDFDMDTADTIQYTVQATSYDLNDQPLGSSSTPIKK